MVFSNRTIRYGPSEMTFRPDDESIERHERWLGCFNPQYLDNWKKLLGNDAEAAMCEVDVRLLLADNGVDVEPNEDLSGARKTPDFLCRKDNRAFYVEVTCIGIDKATEVTGLPHEFTGDPSYSYGLLNNTIFNACRQKTPQCADQSLPSLVVIGTFHFQASHICVSKYHLEDLLTGQRMITQDIDMRTGGGVRETYETTHLRSATFLHPDKDNALDHARYPVSGMLICGFGCRPPNVFGVLHPSPVRQFDRRLLAKIEFCRLKDGYESGQLSTEWI